ncbi:hypothetical protein GOP47_0029849 [Adiantum capillus-veneris]|nr:hypothetical protein GOP47_0029849 [Adiantum capillus-veneris]
MVAESSPYQANITSKAKQRRRRSRAKPRPPITLLTAQDKSHFKAIVHRFTSLGCAAPLDHSLLLPSLFPGIINISAPAAHNTTSTSSSSSPAHFCGSTIAQSLKSSLQMIFSCLQILSRTSPSTMINNQQPEGDLDMTYKANTSLLMQALSGRAGALIQEEETKCIRGAGFSSIFCSNKSCLDSTNTKSCLDSSGRDPSALLRANSSCGGNYREGIVDVTNIGSALQYTSENSFSMQGSGNGTEVESNPSVRPYINIVEGHLEPSFASKENAYFDIMSHEGIINVDVDQELPSPAKNVVDVQDMTTRELERYLLEGDNTINFEDCSFFQ